MPRKAIYRYTVTTSDGVDYTGTAPALAKIFGVQIDTVYARIHRGDLTPEQIFGVAPLPKPKTKPCTRSEKEPEPRKPSSPVKDKTVCKTCIYWAPLAGYSSLRACSYLTETGHLPRGYLDETGHWHRDPGPYAEYAAGRFHSAYNFVHHDPNFKPDGKC